MKLERSKSIILIIIAVLVMALCTVSYAETKATYYLTGEPETITTDKGTIYYYLNGNVEKIETPTGTITYNLDGNIDSVDGTPSISLEEAKAELKKLEKGESIPTNTTTDEKTEEMPETGIENNLIIPIVLFAVAAIVFGVKYNSIRKI